MDGLESAVEEFVTSILGSVSIFLNSLFGWLSDLFGGLELYF